MLRMLGLSSGGAPAETEAARNLPASWYRSPDMYQLERRAVFSRQWILVTHSLRFAAAGDHAAFTIANFSFFLVRDRDGHINGFHNVCRHRAYPVVPEEAGREDGPPGSGTMGKALGTLSCKYHGWSYGFKGNLAKAPRFETVEGFDKSRHGLFPVNVHIDNNGFVWVNLESEAKPGAGPSMAWTDELAGADDQAAMRRFDFAAEFSYDHTWTQQLDANWKALVDNYNECYHCATAHPLIAGVSDLTQYRVEPANPDYKDKTAHLEHTIVNKQQSDGQFRRSINFYFPNVSVTVTDNFFYIQRMVPVTATTSVIENEVYRHSNATDEQFAAINAFYRQVLAEDKELCDLAQRNLNAGVFVAGELHPDKEKGPLHIQNMLRRKVMEHRRKEEAAGHEIWPAVPQMPSTAGLSEEEAFCSKLEAASCGRPELAW